ncbi:futalosine hydrolase [Dactylosporangium aurantiacum]|uniref:Futalosine hydrolase n=1 Tax=Dactylosporangium aurantiacum TaxID=35754 RepID=A0A9Q9IQ73_9ACTN|nr:futalosine hydrolase [Dactylosporangium aurantiacum]
MHGLDRVLVVTAVEAERAAVLRGLGLDDGVESGAGRAAAGPLPVTVVAGGVGPAGAAAATARALTRAECAGRPFGAVLSAGIGGGFDGRAGVADLVLGDLSVAADLGAQDGDDFIDLDRLGFGPARHPADPLLLDRLRAALPAAVVGPVVTVSTATGSAARTGELRRRVPDAAAEGMEGFGVAAAARAAGMPFAELRAISNPVGPRDRAAWRIPQALDTLRAAFAALARPAGQPAGRAPVTRSWPASSR